MIKILLCALTSFAVVLLATPAVIRVAYLRKLVDAPGDERKLHKRHIPTIGGILIFAGTLFSYLLWYPIIENSDFKYIAASMLILFFIGLKDDLVGTAPVKKLAGHLVVAFILVIMADIRITSMHGLFGLYQLPDWASILLSIFTYTVIVNAFNLIDGIDGLASGVGALACVAYGTWFYLAGSVENAVLGFALAGALLGFLVFNFEPAKIFMGDSGSLVIGLVVSVLAIKLIEYKTDMLPPELLLISKPLFAMSAIVYPMVDTLRIFIVRAFQGRSPFSADRNHLHHKLIDLGFSHRGSVILIYSYTIMIISQATLLVMETNMKFVVISVFVILLSQLPPFLLYLQNRKVKP
ncbi:MAG: undecaprenyl/decaprenyl-phosphate alpha-N-acetylglucosaminyl 1-phosphate transferase [Flavobacteriales bacterium]|nr:undecaprenyl/decaprenyl-phosphate alpha-N-acetylglucosaminyl 1-phosphate transferase [Flavobacteriales bacterium]